jgi:hypothetical protein
VYQPLITDENIQKLYRMKLREKRPMTRLINQILDDYFLSYNHDTAERRGTMPWIIPDQTNSPLRPLAWPSASRESSNPD